MSNFIFNQPKVIIYKHNLGIYPLVVSLFLVIFIQTV